MANAHALQAPHARDAENIERWQYQDNTSSAMFWFILLVLPGAFALTVAGIITLQMIANASIPH